MAKRVGDDEVECRPNCFGTQEIDFSDTKNFICSKNLRSYALENGLWKEGEPFNFTKIYGTGPLANDTYGGADWPVNRMRRWNCLHTLCNCGFRSLCEGLLCQTCSANSRRAT